MINTIVLISLLLFNYNHIFVDNPPKEVYNNRREILRSKLSNKEVYIAISSDYYSNEKHSKFRQNSDLLYYTSYPFKNAVLFISKNGFDINGKIIYEILMIKKQDSQDKLWNGPLPTKEDIKNFSGIETILYDYEIDFNNLFENVFEVTVAPYSKGEDFSPYLNSKYIKKKEVTIIEELKDKYPFIIFTDDLKLSKKQREIKDEYEIALLRKAVDISVSAHKTIIKNIKNYNFEYEIEGVIEGEFKRLGAEKTAYNSIVGAGENSCILHYTNNRSKIENGDLVLFDCGAEYHGYASDITRTLPKNGKFSNEQKIIYEIVLNAQKRAIQLCKPGIRFSSVDSIAREVIDSSLISIGLIKSKSQSRQYFPHGTSHYLGLDVHDVGGYDLLQKGNVITVEPGIYIPQGSDCDKKWWNIGIRIEDDVLITTDGFEVLSQKLPKEIKELEELMNK